MSPQMVNLPIILNEQLAWIARGYHAMTLDIIWRKLCNLQEKQK